MRMDFISDTWENLILIYAISFFCSGDKVFLLQQTENKSEKKKGGQKERNIGERKNAAWNNDIKGTVSKRRLVLYDLKKDYV